MFMYMYMYFIHYLPTGCAFVTYASREIAEKAQMELHDQLILPSVCTVLHVTIENLCELNLDLIPVLLNLDLIPVLLNLGLIPIHVLLNLDLIPVLLNLDLIPIVYISHFNPFSIICYMMF